MDARHPYLLYIIGGVAVLIVALSLGGYRPDSYSFIPRVAEVPAMAITGAPVHEVMDSELEERRIHAKGSVFENLSGFSNYSLESEMPLTVDQRLGQPVLLSVPLAFMKSFGLRFFHAMERLLLGLAIFLVIRRLRGGTWGAIVGALSMVLSSFALNISYLNPNITSVLIACGIFYLLLDDKPSGSKTVLAGFLVGALALVAHVSLCFIFVAPLLVLRRLAGRAPRQRRGVLFFLLGILAVMGPWLAFMLIHDVQLGREVSFALIPNSPEIEGKVLQEISKRLDVTPEVAARYVYDLGPVKLFFYGLLNYPIHHTLIRCGDYPFPFSLLSLLIVIQSFGVLLVGFALHGFGAMVRETERRGPALMVAAWFIGFLSFFSLFENLDPYKTTFILWMFPPVAILAGVGLSRILEPDQWRRTLPAAALCVIAVFLVPILARGVEVPVDSRWADHFRMKKFSRVFIDVAEEKSSQLRQTLTAGNLLPGDCDDLFYAGPEHTTPSLMEMAREMASFQAEIPADTLNTAFLRAVRSTGPGSIVIYNSIASFSPGTVLRTDPIMLKGPLPSPFMQQMLDELDERLRSADNAMGRVYFVDQLFFSQAAFLRERFDLETTWFDGHFVVYKLSLKDGGVT